MGFHTDKAKLGALDKRMEICILRIKDALIKSKMFSHWNVVEAFQFMQYDYLAYLESFENEKDILRNKKFRYRIKPQGEWNLKRWETEQIENISELWKFRAGLMDEIEGYAKEIKFRIEHAHDWTDICIDTINQEKDHIKKSREFIR